MMPTHDRIDSTREHFPRVFVLPGVRTIVQRLIEDVRGLGSEPSVVGLATGNTFQAFFDALVDAERNRNISARLLTFTHLDEWLGHPVGAVGGMATEISERLLARFTSGVAGFVPVPAEPDDPAIDAAHELELQRLGGIDLQLLGIGRNGHVAFNEPGTPLSARTHVARVTDGTRDANAARFAGGTVPRYARTLGPRSIQDARRLVLVATGDSKAEAVRSLLEGSIGSHCPATVVRLHPNATIYLDVAAASLLSADVTRSPADIEEVQP